MFKASAKLELIVVWHVVLTGGLYLLIISVTLIEWTVVLCERRYSLSQMVQNLHTHVNVDIQAR